MIRFIVSLAGRRVHGAGAVAVGPHLKTRDAVVSVLGATAVHVVLPAFWQV
ncbi:hypothetical protein [Nonomuraea solani]|uniref:hypothetical protein n=1 Tax=Nonomuraea solani TaxID=1144553 RepID=UPI00135C0CEA|nr:hypothetical protein [Nonomuraea solani]